MLPKFAAVFGIHWLTTKVFITVIKYLKIQLQEHAYHSRTVVAGCIVSMEAYSKAGRQLGQQYGFLALPSILS
jgi:hypothetical protein